MKGGKWNEDALIGGIIFSSVTRSLLPRIIAVGKKAI
jgi:hypothetical protein